LERYMKRFLSLGKILYAVLLAVTGLAVLLLVNCIFSNKGRHGRKRRGGVPAVLAGICIAGWSLFLLLGFSLYFGVFHQGVAARQLMESDYFSGVAQMAREQAAKRLQDNGYDTGISEEAFALSNIYIDEKQYTDDVWMYRYDLVTKSGEASGLQASHAFDLPAMFANRDFHFSKFIFDGEAEEVVDGIIREMHGSWVRFTKTGAPGDAWPRYAGYDCEIRIFDRETRTERVDHTALMAAWGDMRFYEN